jgi:hypothetical protein
MFCDPLAAKLPEGTKHNIVSLCLSMLHVANAYQDIAAEPLCLLRKDQNLSDKPVFHTP